MVRGNKDSPRIWKGVREDHCMGSGAEGGAEGPPELGLPQRHVGGNQPLPVNGKGNVHYLSRAKCPQEVAQKLSRDRGGIWLRGQRKLPRGAEV